MLRPYDVIAAIVIIAAIAAIAAIVIIAAILYGLVRSRAAGPERHALQLPP